MNFITVVVVCWSGVLYYLLYSIIRKSIYNIFGAKPQQQRDSIVVARRRYNATYTKNTVVSQSVFFYPLYISPVYTHTEYRATILLLSFGRQSVVYVFSLKNRSVSSHHEFAGPWKNLRIVMFIVFLQYCGILIYYCCVFIIIPLVVCTGFWGKILRHY